jgi:hypothetical protein
MGKSVYARKFELLKEWNKLYKGMNVDIPFEEYQKIYEKENDLYQRWLFYDKLLKRLEVLNRGEQKKKCNQKQNSTNKRS